jgi:hypothetical protein
MLRSMKSPRAQIVVIIQTRDIEIYFGIVAEPEKLPRFGSSDHTRATIKNPTKKHHLQEQSQTRTSPTLTYLRQDGRLRQV